MWQKETLRSRHYDVVQAYIRCRVIERERVACVSCGAFTTAEMPPMPCNRAQYTSAFLAWLVSMKFELLVPLDRVRTHLLLKGVDLAMGTLVHLIARATALATDVDNEHWRLLCEGPYIAFDGTGLKTLIPGQEHAWDGYLEVFARDELSVFRYDVTKHAPGLTEHLADYDGLLLCDAESRNRKAAGDNNLAHCNAHPLRAYRKALTVHPKLARQGKRFIEALYELEDLAVARGLTGEQLREFRQRRSRRVLHRYRQWIDGVLAMDLPRTDPVRKVAQYTLNHWEGLTRFVDRPELALDNNVSEREFQRHAKLRYASLFAGSVAGAERWATLLGVVRTAQKCGVDVRAYLTWLFDHSGTHKDKLGRSPAELTPMAYRAYIAEQAARAA